MSETIKYLNDSNFTETIANGVTLVDFYADWCGPCRGIAPIIEELSIELKGQVTIAKLDIDAAQETTQAFDVTSIPTIIIFKNGREISRVTGLRDKKFLMQLITSALSA